MKKHLTVVEVSGTYDNNIVGTVLDVTNDEAGRNKFIASFQEMIMQHFDCNDFRHSDIPNLFDFYLSKEEIGIEIDGMNYEVKILENWIY